MSALIPPDWPYTDTPWDLLQDCYYYDLHQKYATKTKCIVATLLGAWSAYIFPIVFVLIVIGTAFCFIAFAVARKEERPSQTVYLYFLCGTGLITSMMFGLLWLFPAKGLPYATQSRVYYFIMYHSSIGCSLYRFTYSFIATASDNILVVATADRCLMLFFPVKFANLPKRYAWYVSTASLVVSFLMMTPYFYFFQLITVAGKITCTIPHGNTFLEVYHTLFSNAGIVQPILIVIINVVFMFQLSRRTGRRVSTTSTVQAPSPTSSDEAIFRRYSFVLVIMSTVYVVSALAQGIAYMVAFALTKSSSPVESNIRLAYNIADLGWHVYFLRVLLNLLLLVGHFPACTHLCKRLYTRKYQKTNKNNSSERA